MSLVDTHCHLDFHQYDADRERVLKRAWESGLSRILVPGIDIPTSQNAIQLSGKDPRIYAAVGVHPNSSSAWDQWTEESLALLSNQKKVVAIGEIGLDYYRDLSPKELQKEVLKVQLKIASQKKLPVIIHTRNASSNDRCCITDVIDLLNQWKHNMEYPGVIHSYSGNVEEARQFISMGYFLGITGPVTYKNAGDLRKVVAAVPLERLLIETDSPFLSPQQKRGKRNEPANVRFIAQKIAEVRDQSETEVITQIQKNAAKLFRWEETVQGEGRL